MSKAEIVEDHDIITAPVPVNDDKIAALIAMSEKLDALGAALDKFRTFVLRRALPGDFVAFKGDDGDECLSLTGAAADRVAADLGISFVDWKDYKEAGTDEKGAWYTWWYECTTLWNGRRLERTTGRAGSRDRFFGKKDGEYKALADLNEGDIRTAARRTCMKEGVAIMLGLRKIPREAAIKMGIEVGKIKSVGFGSSKGKEAAPAGTPVWLVAYEVKNMKYKDQNRPDGKKTFPKWLFTDSGGAKYETNLEKVAAVGITFVDKYKAAKETAPKCVVVYEKTQYGNDLKAVKDAPAAASGAAATPPAKPAEQGA